jgi:HD-GYP domain-containing protein (c-di-GMP phosphodiesterase class II)
MRPVQTPANVHASDCPACHGDTSSRTRRFDQLAARLRRAGLVWAQAEPGFVHWSTQGDPLTTLVADSPWIRRQVGDVLAGWSDGEHRRPREIIAGCWALPGGISRRSDGRSQGVAVALTQRITGPQGSLRALCQSVHMDHQLTADLLLQSRLATGHEIPRLAAMVRLIRPAPLRPTTMPGVEALLRAIEATHRSVRGHSERTAELAFRLAAAAGMTISETRSARVAGLLHDVGKLGVPEGVLRKPGALSPDERAMVNLHPEIGQRIVQGLGGLDHAVPSILWHHERWDGHGYPHRLSGERIPRLARLMAIVDSFDAMRQDRPYRRALSVERSLREIREGAGRQFDPGLADTFVRMVDREPALAA